MFLLGLGCQNKNTPGNIIEAATKNCNLKFISTGWYDTVDLNNKVDTLQRDFSKTLECSPHLKSKYIPVGSNVTKERPIYGTILASPLIIYSEPDTSAEVIFREHWEVQTEYSTWDIVEIKNGFIKIKYKDSWGWLPENNFVCNWTFLLSPNGELIKKIPSIILDHTIECSLLSNDQKYLYISEYGCRFFKIDLSTDELIGLVDFKEVVNNSKVPLSRLRYRTKISNLDYLLVHDMGFKNYFNGWVTNQNVYYEYTDVNEFKIKLINRISCQESVFSDGIPKGNRNFSFFIESIFANENDYVCVSLLSESR